MRRSLIWIFAASLVLSAYVLRPESDSDTPSEEPLEVSKSAVEGRPSIVKPCSNALLVAGVESLRLERADFDPFFASVAIRPVEAAAPASTETPKPAIRVVTASPNYRYFGNLTDPAGNRLAVLALGDRDLIVAAGAQLGDDVLLRSVETDGVYLQLIPTNEVLFVPIEHAREGNLR